MKYKFNVGDLIWILVLCCIFSIFLIPATRVVYEEFYGLHPYIGGFLKFMILASMGEVLALRIKSNVWKKTNGFIMKAVAWGFIGILITFMFKLYPSGISVMIDAGLLPGADGVFGRWLFAFYTSVIVNLSFGPIFMALHRISDTLIESIADKRRMTVLEAVSSIDWVEFIRFILGKTIPYFWIPAHIITFFIPDDYRILFAAFLSIALGIILTVAKSSKVEVDRS